MADDVVESTPEAEPEPDPRAELEAIERELAEIESAVAARAQALKVVNRTIGEVLDGLRARDAALKARRDELLRQLQG